MRVGKREKMMRKGMEVKVNNDNQDKTMMKSNKKSMTNSTRSSYLLSNNNRAKDNNRSQMRTTNNNNNKKMVKIYKTPQSNNRGIKLMSMSNNRIARVINNRMIKMMKIYKISKKATLTNSQFSHKRKGITAITKIAITKIAITTKISITTIRDNPNNN